MRDPLLSAYQRVGSVSVSLAPCWAAINNPLNKYTIVRMRTVANGTLAHSEYSMYLKAIQRATANPTPRRSPIPQGIFRTARAPAEFCYHRRRSWPPSENPAGSLFSLELGCSSASSITGRACAAV